MKKLAAVLLAVSVAISAGPALAATNLLSNGSFESGLAGWSVTSTGQGQTGYENVAIGKYNTTSNPAGTFVVPDNAAANPNFDNAGNSFLYLLSDVGVQTLSQLVQLEAGTSYTFGFDYLLPGNGFANPNGATLKASLGDQVFTSVSANDASADRWQYASGARTFTAAQSGSFAFSFTPGGHAAKDFAIDRVFLSKTSAVPEPATWAMMLVGFAFVGAALKRARQSATGKLRAA